MFLVLYVDDILLLPLMLEFINKIKNLIRTKFQFRDKASIKSFLGIEFKYDQQRLMMSNKSKIMNLCEQYKDMLPRATKVPIASTELIMKPSPTSKHVHTYQSIIGSLNFIAYRTRPDLTIYIHKLSKFMRSPTEHQFQLLLSLLAYTINTANYEMIYETRPNFIDELEVYSDSGFIDKENFTSRSVSGVIVLYFGMVVLWSAKQQSIVTDDNCCTELHAMNSGAKLVLGIKNLMIELKLIGDASIKLKVDNSATKTIPEQSFRINSRHYHLSLLFINDCVKRNEVVVEKVKSENNVADVFTKFVINTLFYSHRDTLNIINTTKRSSQRIKKYDSNLRGVLK